MPKLPDDDDDYRAGRGSSDPEADAEDVPGRAGPSAPKPPSPLRWTDPDRAWLTEPPAERRFLVGFQRPGQAGREPEAPVGFLPMGEACMLAAAGASGKTFLAISLALAVAGGRRPGRRWLGGDSAPSPLVMMGQPGRVALVLAEDRADEIRRRIQAQAAMDGLDWRDIAGRLVILPREGLPDGDPALVRETERGSGSYVASPFGVQLRAELTERAGSDGWALVVLDPLSAFGGPEAEVDNAAATAVIREIERFAELPGGPAVLLTHHTRKSASGDKRRGYAPDADDIRGASGLVNRVRWAMTGRAMGETKGDGARITRWDVVKYNYGPPMPAILVAHPRYESGAVRVALSSEKVVKPAGKPDGDDDTDTDDKPASDVKVEPEPPRARSKRA